MTERWTADKKMVEENLDYMIPKQKLSHKIRIFLTLGRNKRCKDSDVFFHY